jgi:hypothetical protein
VLVRLYFALSPSYLHPDENFQGPEVIAGMCVPSPESVCDRTGQFERFHLNRAHLEWGQR